MVRLSLNKQERANADHYSDDAHSRKRDTNPEGPDIINVLRRRMILTAFGSLAGWSSPAPCLGFWLLESCGEIAGALGLDGSLLTVMDCSAASVDLASGVWAHNGTDNRATISSMRFMAEL
jgi:hypothetical protein